MQVALGEALAGADWDARVRWLRRLGVGALVRDAPGRGPALERLDRRERHGAAAELLRVPAPRERVFRPRAVRVVSSPDEAFRAVASGELADDVALVGAEVAHGARGAARLVESGADRTVVEVEGDGGVVGLLRGFHPLWRARLEGGEAIPTARVDLVLLGVVVPPGRHRVELATTPAPLGSAAVAALALLGATAAFVLAGRRERGRA
jgi:hypothetical protein